MTLSEVHRSQLRILTEDHETAMKENKDHMRENYQTQIDQLSEQLNLLEKPGTA